MVGVKGLEPSTSASQTPRASQLRHTPSSNRALQLLVSITSKLAAYVAFLLSIYESAMGAWFLKSFRKTLGIN